MDVLCMGIMACDLIAGPVTEEVFSKDTTTVQKINMQCGGDAFNVAINLAKLGVSSGVCGKIGADMFGDFLSKAGIENGVDMSNVSRCEGEATTTSIVLVSPNGERNFIFQQGALESFCLRDFEMEISPIPKVFAVGSAFGLPGFSGGDMAELLKKAKKLGMTTVLDVTGNPGKVHNKDCALFLPYVDMFVPSLDEAAAISGKERYQDIAKHFQELGARTVVVKMGRNGAFAMDSQEQFLVPATPDVAVDTTGAGDSFVAGLIAAFLKGWPLRKQLIFACKAAGLSVTCIGATKAMLPFDSVDSRWREYYINQEDTK